MDCVRFDNTVTPGTPLPVAIEVAAFAAGAFVRIGQTANVTTPINPSAPSATSTYVRDGIWKFGTAP